MFRAVLGDTRAYDGCIKVDVYEDRDNATITLVEEWETLAHQQKYLGWRIETGIQDATKDILDGGFDNGVTVHTWGIKKDYWSHTWGWHKNKPPLKRELKEGESLIDFLYENEHEEKM